MIVKRTPYDEGAQRVIGEFFYAPVITNRRGAGSSIIPLHLARGGDENCIEEFKKGLGARTLLSRRFKVPRVSAKASIPGTDPAMREPTIANLIVRLIILPLHSAYRPISLTPQQDIARG